MEQPSPQAKHYNPQQPSPPHICDHALHSNKPCCFETVSKGKELEDIIERVERLENEREERNGLMLRALESLTSIKNCLSRVIEGLEGEKDETFVKEGEGERVSVETDQIGEESRVLLEEVRLVTRLANEVALRVDEYKELKKKEKRELESSLISLTEENRDVNNLLRIALLEKEALEKRIKGHDHKRTPLLQFAEFGLQKVGFGFMMGGGTGEQQTDREEANRGTKSDSSGYEEEVVSLVSYCYLDKLLQLYFHPEECSFVL